MDNIKAIVDGIAEAEREAERLMQEALVASVGMAFWAFISLIMINFAIELGVNVVLAPAIYSVDNVIEKRLSGKVKNNAA